MARIERAELDFNLRVSPLAIVEETVARERQERILSLSRAKHATPRAEVEAELAGEFTTARPETEVQKRTEPSRGAEPAETSATEEVKADRSEPESETVLTGLETEEEIRSARSRTRVRPVPPEARSLGKGGNQHKYLQTFIKCFAENKGYLVTIEKPVLAGQGSDVALERDGRSIACEISVTTTVDHEIGNLEKCLAAGLRARGAGGLGKKDSGEGKANRSNGHRRGKP